MQTHSPAETRALGARLAQLLLPGDVLLLEGDLGAGKSELTRGIARGLGVDGPVSSPSFTILNVYDSGRIPLYHFDWYRLNSAEELYEMGMDEYLGGDGVAVVEWPSRCPDAIPADHLLVTVTPLGETVREITWTPCGTFRPLSIPDSEEEAH
ncbi:MAG: tRNA (adenosine(37)-N6)-threonylcarbamoyltransferase complex ATPase subunit type 1 TsaE [Clostridia bacterium]|nr:tRNA (adenosine(37)-N6)-threonylcarbamoyltransferase complex ATPase subunit type 1 TsaE [Clostridia bacterium]